MPNLVYSGSGHEVKAVMVAGKVLARNGEVLVADEAAYMILESIEEEPSFSERARWVSADELETIHSQVCRTGRRDESDASRRVS